MSYQQSQTLIAEAEQALSNNEIDQARLLYREAAELQEEIVRKLPEDKVNTRSVYGLSAATLYFRANELAKAARLAHFVLSGEMVERRSAEKLEELLSGIHNERSLQNRGYAGVSTPLACFLRGDQILSGLAPKGLVDRFTDALLSVVRRMAGSMGEMEFTSRPSAVLEEKYQILQKQAVPGSYRVDFFLTVGSQLELPFGSRVVNPDLVVNSTLQFISASTKLTDTSLETLEHLVPNEKYRAAMLRLVRNVVPDGRGVNEIELRRGDSEREDAIIITADCRASVRDLINPPVESNSVLSRPQKDEELSGVLRAVDLDRRQVKLDVENQAPVRFKVPDTISEDVLGPMLNHTVTVRRSFSKNGTKWTVRDMDFTDAE